MALRFRRFAALTLTGLTLSGPLAHLMELPAKMRYGPALYTRLQQSLYFNYGRFAGTAEILALLATADLAWRSRKASPARFGPALLAAGGTALAHAIFWKFVSPANAEMASWAPNNPPADWTRWRKQWEFGHAARGVLEVLAFAALAHSTLDASTPADARPRLRAETPLS